MLEIARIEFVNSLTEDRIENFDTLKNYNFYFKNENL